MGCLFVQCCFRSTQTVRTTRDGETQDVHLDFHSAPQLWQWVACSFSVALGPLRPYGLLGTQDVRLDFHIAPEICHWYLLLVLMFLYVHTDPYGLLGTGKPKTSASIFTQLLKSATDTFFLFWCSFTFTRTVRTTRDGDVRLDFHTAPEICHWYLLLVLMFPLRSHGPYGLLGTGTGSPRRPPRFSHSSWATILFLPLMIIRAPPLKGR